MADSLRRERLRAAFNYTCGFCGVREDECGSELEEDHYQPRDRGGADTFENLVYCCPTCNRIKNDFWNADSASAQRILHPQRDDLSSHLQEGRDGRLTALTATGTFHIRRLRLNRPQLVAVRLRRQQLSAVQEENTRSAGEIRRLTEQQDELITLAERALDGDQDAIVQLRETLRRA